MNLLNNILDNSFDLTEKLIDVRNKTNNIFQSFID